MKNENIIDILVDLKKLLEKGLNHPYSRATAINAIYKCRDSIEEWIKILEEKEG